MTFYKLAVSFYSKLNKKASAKAEACVEQTLVLQAILVDYYGLHDCDFSPF
ncbi:hypothetical protein D3C76_714600 [compost metagenome]